MIGSVLETLKPETFVFAALLMGVIANIQIRSHQSRMDDIDADVLELCLELVEKGCLPGQFLKDIVKQKRELRKEWQSPLARVWDRLL